MNYAEQLNSYFAPSDSNSKDIPPNSINTPSGPITIFITFFQVQHEY